MSNKIGTSVIAIIWLIFGLALLRFMYKHNWFNVLSALFTDTFTIVLYWISIIFIVFVVCFGIPIYLLIQTFSEADSDAI